MIEDKNNTDVNETTCNMEVISKNILLTEDENNDFNNDEEIASSDDKDGSILKKTNDRKSKNKLQSHTAKILNVHKEKKIRDISRKHEHHNSF